MTAMRFRATRSQMKFGKTKVRLVQHVVVALAAKKNQHQFASSVMSVVHQLLRWRMLKQQSLEASSQLSESAHLSA
jgi:hypothetical protein